MCLKGGSEGEGGKSVAKWLAAVSYMSFFAPSGIISLNPLLPIYLE